MPKDSLGILDLATGRIERYPFVKNLRISDKLNTYVAFQDADKPAPKPEPKKEVKEKEKPAPDADKKPAPKKPEPKDNLYVMDINTLAIDTIACVESFIVSEKGDKVAYITKPDKKDSVNVRGVFLW